jgi:HTH-type transcriptional repressor of NAD biosynthesis genes
MINGIKLVCFYGPESTGKSAMAVSMAKKYHTEYVPEVAKEFISNNNFSQEDIIKIGNAHFQRILEKMESANKILFCDTDAITTQIYSQHYLNIIPSVLLELESKVKFDQYFLFDIDVPWVADGIRDLGNGREEMFNVFKNALEKRKINYILVTGDWLQRENIITKEVDKILQT